MFVSMKPRVTFAFSLALAQPTRIKVIQAGEHLCLNAEEKEKYTHLPGPVQIKLDLFCPKIIWFLHSSHLVIIVIFS